MHWSWVIIAALTLYYYYRFKAAKKQDNTKQARGAAGVDNNGPAPPAVDLPQPHQNERVIGPEDFEDAGFDPDLDQLNHRANNNNNNNRAAAGPSSDRVVGTKKARSLERKDQRRAYFEHLRMQAQYDREEREEYDRQYADLRAEEQAAQAAANQAAAAAREAALAASRQEARDAATAARRAETDVVAGLGERGALHLSTDTDREAAARIVQRSSNGAVVAGRSGSSSGGSGGGSRDAQHFVVGEAADWLVRLSEPELGALAAQIQARGRVSFAELAQYLTDLKRQ